MVQSLGCALQGNFLQKFKDFANKVKFLKAPNQGNNQNKWNYLVQDLFKLRGRFFLRRQSNLGISAPPLMSVTIDK